MGHSSEEFNYESYNKSLFDTSNWFSIIFVGEVSSHTLRAFIVSLGMTIVLNMWLFSNVKNPWKFYLCSNFFTSQSLLLIYQDYVPLTDEEVNLVYGLVLFLFYLRVPKKEN